MSWLLCGTEDNHPQIRRDIMLVMEDTFTWRDYGLPDMDWWCMLIMAAEYFPKNYIYYII